MKKLQCFVECWHLGCVQGHKIVIVVHFNLFLDSGASQVRDQRVDLILDGICQNRMDSRLDELLNLPDDQVIKPFVLNVDVRFASIDVNAYYLYVEADRFRAFGGIEHNSGIDLELSNCDI